MGAVKRDIHKQERRFEEINLSDVDVVKWLILYRDKVDTYKDIEINRDINEAGDIDEFNVSLINLYICLDEVINKCNFDESQLALINLLSIGYTQEDIAEILKHSDKSQISRKFDTICKKIVEKNHYIWTIYIHKNYLKTEFKKCVKCNEELPKNAVFFGTEKKSKDGFKGRCRKCHNL